MKLFIGLGNPGKEYENTRHNVGAKFIDFLTEKLCLNYQEKFKSLYADIQIKGEKVIFLKPQTFMNSSGSAVREAVDFYKIKNEEIFLAFDDLDILEGEWKLQLGKYPKVHNGVNDVIEKLGVDKINFIRIGIDGRNQIEKDLVPGRDYVLQKTNYDFKKVFEEIESRLFINELTN